MASQQFRNAIREDMVVYSADGEKLGKVTRIVADGFEIEKGLFFRREYEARFSDVIEVREGEILLSTNKDELEARSAGEGREQSITGAISGAIKGAIHGAEQTRSAAGTAEPAMGIKPPGPGEEARVPLVEEQVIARKNVVEAGEVVIHKETVTEERQVTVPVQREVVRVERVPATGEPVSTLGAFQEETVTIPVREEVVALEKQPVVREEVVVTKESRAGTETAATTVRREDVAVESTGNLKEREVPAENQQEEPPLRKAS